MKLTLSETRFSKHEYVPQTQTLYSTWHEHTRDMTEEDFRKEMLLWAEIVQLKKPIYLVDDCRKFFYTIAPLAQKWSAQLQNQTLVKCGLKKYAHIAPEEFIANLATMQYFDEFFEMKLPGQFPVEHFSQIQAAEHWLFSA
jgi:hypothetical protein